MMIGAAECLPLGILQSTNMHAVHAGMHVCMMRAVVYMLRVAKLDPAKLDLLGMLSLVTTWGMLGAKFSKARTHQAAWCIPKCRLGVNPWWFS